MSRRTRRRARRWAWAALAWAWVGCAWAAPSRAQEGEEGEIIEVEGAREDRLAPSMPRASLEVERLRLTGGGLPEALLELPGAWVRRSGAEGAAAELSVRGLGGGRALVLLDGVPLNPARGGGAELALLPASLIERVELVRGGSGARYGSGAVGGVLEVTTRAPGDALAWEAGMGAGSFGRLQGQAGASGGLGGGGRWLVGVEGLGARNDFTFEDRQGTTKARSNADVRRLGGLGTVEVPAWGGVVGATGWASGLERGVSGPGEFQEQLAAARQEEAESVGVLRGSWRGLGDGGWGDVRGRIGHRWGASSYHNPRPLLTSAAAYGVSTREHALDGALEGSAWLLDGALVTHGLLEARQSWLARERRGAAGAASEGFERGSAAAASFVEVGLLGGALRLLPALRLEGVEGAGASWLPALGAVASLGGGWSARGNVARAWRAPSLDELYLAEEFLTGDPDLRPEDALNADLGLGWAGRQGRAEVSVFQSAVDDIILFLPVSPTRYRAQNAGSAEIVGVELDGAWRPWTGATLRGGGSWTRARFGFAPFDPLPGVPAWKGFAEARQGFLGVEVFGRLRGRSAIALDNFGSLENPPWASVDAGVSWGPVEGWVLSLTGQNLGDVQTAEDALQTPLPGRSVHVQITFMGGGAGAEPGGVR